jgi:HemX protein
MHPVFASVVNAEPDRLWIVLATIFFFFGSLYSAYALAMGKALPRWVNLCALGAGFILQTVFLCMRGHAIGRCPITNPFEVIVFMSWSIALIYLVVGSSYRLSLLGGFTAPVVAAMGLAALFLPASPPALFLQPVNPWLEAHASFSMIACGAFALACVAGAMYLFQEHQLKTRQPTSIFFRLPPINALTVANTRLLWLGFGFLSLGLAAGFCVGRATDAWKVGWSIVVWLLYGGILLARSQRRVAAKWVARLSILAFSLLLSTFWGIRFISETRPL